MTWKWTTWVGPEQQQQEGGAEAGPGRGNLYSGEGRYRTRCGKVKERAGKSQSCTASLIALLYCNWYRRLAAIAELIMSEESVTKLTEILIWTREAQAHARKRATRGLANGRDTQERRRG